MAGTRRKTTLALVAVFAAVVLMVASYFVLLNWDWWATGTIAAKLRASHDTGCPLTKTHVAGVVWGGGTIFTVNACGATVGYHCMPRKTLGGFTYAVDCRPTPVL